MKKIFILTLPILILPLIVLIYTKNTLPPKNKTIQIPGLNSEVQVYKDKNGISHINAENENDAYFALGFTMASDRLFQMELLRRVVAGELSEIFGEEMLQTDKTLRTLRLKDSMKGIVQKSKDDPEKKLTLSLMNSFYEGVNHFSKTQTLPIEFTLLGIKPKSISIEEGAGITGYLGLSFAEGMIADALFSELLQKLPQKKVRELMVRIDNDKNSAVKNASKSKIDFPTSFFKGIFKLEEKIGLWHGSNSWVISSKKSKSNTPLLANDPHVSFSNPGIWYEAHIKTPNHEMYGHFVPLVPFAAMGHDKNRGWAVTMAEVDDLDFYQETIDWEHKKVLFKNKWVPLKEEVHSIKIKGKDKPVKHIVYITPHGPLVDNTPYGKKGSNLSLKWSYHHPDNDPITAFYKLNYSKDLSDLKEAIKHASTPGLNVSWADKKGNIALHIMAFIPLRPNGVRGNVVLDGASGEHEYLRYLTVDENPKIYNPEKGYIVTANYYPEFAPPYDLDGYWQPSERFERIEDLLKTKEKWSIEELKQVQTDQFVHNVNLFKPIFLKALKKENLNEFEKQVYKLFFNWDGSTKKPSVGSTIYNMWARKIGKNISSDELGEENFILFAKIADFWHFYKTVIKDDNSDWWDDKRTKEIETKNQIIVRSFKETIKVLKDKFGDDPKIWHWGKLHQIVFNHPFGKKSYLKFFNLGPFPSGGGAFQINNMGSKRFDMDFKITYGPSTRRLVDFKDPALSYGILPTGNSGNIFSNFHDDQVEMFLDGKYRRQYMNQADILENLHSKLTLKPIKRK